MFFSDLLDVLPSDSRLYVSSDYGFLGVGYHYQWCDPSLNNLPCDLFDLDVVSLYSSAADLYHVLLKR